MRYLSTEESMRQSMLAHLQYITGFWFIDHSELIPVNALDEWRQIYYVKAVSQLYWQPSVEEKSNKSVHISLKYG